MINCKPAVKNKEKSYTACYVRLGRSYLQHKHFQCFPWAYSQICNLGIRTEHMCQVCYYLWAFPDLLNCLSLSHLCLLTGLFVQVFWLKFYMHITLLPYMLFVLPIMSYLFHHHYKIRMKSRNCVASHNAVFPNPLLLLVLEAPTFSLASCSQPCNIFILLFCG